MAYRRASYRRPGSVRSRGSAFALAVVVNLLLLLMLVRLGVPFIRAPERAKPVTFRMLPEAQVAPTPAPTVPKTRHASRAASPAPAAVAPPPPAPTPPVPAPPSPMLTLSKDAFAATDIGHMPSHAEEPGQGADAGKDSAAAYGPGEGPGGERLYNAEWYVEPTNAELAFYMPPGGAPPGWAMVACRTIANYHVENCRELGESPIGSGLARTLREAAWQFRVRPPRIGGRALIGAWVRIRFDFTTGTAK